MNPMPATQRTSRPDWHSPLPRAPDIFFHLQMMCASHTMLEDSGRSYSSGESNCSLNSTRHNSINSFCSLTTKLIAQSSVMLPTGEKLDEPSYVLLRPSLLKTYLMLQREGRQKGQFVRDSDYQICEPLPSKGEHVASHSVSGHSRSFSFCDLSSNIFF